MKLLKELLLGIALVASVNCNNSNLPELSRGQGIYPFEDGYLLLTDVEPCDGSYDIEERVHDEKKEICIKKGYLARSIDQPNTSVRVVEPEYFNLWN